MTNQDITNQIESIIKELVIPQKNSHKGQNGKLLLIGGSSLFHAASKWSLDIASKIVDMVFYSSVEENNQLIQQIKSGFWNGIVIPREDLQSYISEADCVLIGPGMERNQETEELTNRLLTENRSKKFVLDAGGLQMLDPSLLNENHIITPHIKEMINLKKRADDKNVSLDDKKVVILEKGQVDLVTWYENDKNTEKKYGYENDMEKLPSNDRKIYRYENDQNIKNICKIEGGNAGMTKGGTGDVLAGLVASLYCTNQAHVAAIVASKVNKSAGDELFTKVGPFFNASDLVEQIPKTLWQMLRR